MAANSPLKNLKTSSENREQGISHLTSAPYLPSSNGLAERGVQSMKQSLRKMSEDGGTLESKIQNFLIQYRRSPHSSTGLSPFEAMFGRPMRNTLTLMKKKRAVRAVFGYGSRTSCRPLFKEYGILTIYAQMTSSRDTSFPFADLSFSSLTSEPASSDTGTPQSTAEILTERLAPYSGKLSVAHLNTRSMRPPSKFPEFTNIILGSGLDIICVTESWLDPSISNAEVSLLGYRMIRHDRVGKGGSLDQFEEALEFHLPNYEHKLMMGDFNVDLSTTNPASTNLRTIFSSLNLHILPTDATHHEAHSHSLLDLMVVGDEGRVLSHGQLPVGSSDHDLIYLVLSLFPPKPIPKLITCRNFKNFEANLFLDDARSADWNFVYSAPDIDSKVLTFNNIVTSLFDKHAPFRTFIAKHQPVPWMTPPLKHLINRRDEASRKFAQMQTKTFPEIWKKALIRPIPKTKNPSSASDYRPISLHQQVTTHINRHNLLNPFQSGFRTGHSTCSALLKVSDNIQAAMDKTMATILILFDFICLSTTFRLALMVVIIISTPTTSRSTCPSDQLIYLFLYISSILRFSFWSHGPNPKRSSSTHKKTKVLFICSPGVRRTIPLPIPPIEVDGNRVEVVDSARNLGIIFDNALSWVDEVPRIRKKCIWNPLTLKRIKKFTSQNSQIKLVKSFILPKFEYCAPLLHGLTLELSTSLQRAQNSCVRFIYNVRRREHITPYYNRLQRLRIEDRRRILTLSVLYKLLKSRSPPYLYEKYQFRADVSSRDTRSHELLLDKPRHYTQSYSNAFLLSSIDLWNSLPLPILNSLSFFSFKTLLDKAVSEGLSNRP
ncbi:hypothetical protein M8J77_008987 [Diaphorina citri]|nr:hypothetical protein M8J77_008987 [Diaphorina citri]